MRRRAFLKRMGILSGPGWLAGQLAGFAKSAPSPLSRFKLGSISDEWSQDFEEALKTMKSYGLEWVEIRTLWNIYNTEASPDQMQRIKNLLHRYQFKVSVLDTALFKCTLPGTKPVGNDKDAYPYSQQIELLKRGIERADALGADKLRVFAFWRVAQPEEHFERIAEELRRAARLAQESGMRLVLENESACNVATGGELGRMLDLVSSVNFGGNWDIGNGYWQGEVSFPAGYAALPKHRIWHMHVKDVRCGAAATRQKAEAWKLKGGQEESEASPCQTAIVGTGQIDLLGQFRALIKNGYQGTMSLEPEYEDPKTTHLQATERSLEGLLKIMAAALA